ncbi:protein MAIN-LIKE 1-like [Papaver somniferum]|uniref:protein MAIN-LIKE 1-like n=1 Tax=Papaver somniferum TaxID=3469 RepID=UPI000E6FE9B4|nr:protein MAIN-LIKE 1-like [Papaver somniferum]
MTKKKKVDEDCSDSNQANPPIGEEEQFQFLTPPPEKLLGMTYMRYPDRMKNKRGNNLTQINHTPTPRGDKHLGVDYRGIHKDEKKKKNQFEIRLREPSVGIYGVELEGSEPNEQEIEELGEEYGNVRTLVASSGLGHGVLNTQSEYDSVVVSSFRERYWLETDTFHLSFGEMTIIPDDVKQILDLEVEGKSVYEGFDNNMSWTDLYSLVEETLGWDKDDTEMEFMLAGGYDPSQPHKVSKVKKLLLNNLKTKFGDTLKKQLAGEVIDETRARRTAKTYLLYSIGTVFMPDNSGNMVNVHYLQLLKDLKKTREYSWGTATLAYLLESLRKASRVGATEIAGNVALLMAWVHDHFPSLRPSTEWEEDDDRPTGKKFMFTGIQKRNKEERLIQVRQEIAAFTVKDVTFDPYLRI